MKTHVDDFCDAFYRWWRDQTAPQKMTHEKAAKLLADGRSDLEAKLVPARMAKDVFDQHMDIAQKVVLFGVSWNEAAAKSMAELQREHKIPAR